MTTSPGSYEFVEGATSDLSFVARGSSLEAAFGAAAEALLAATVENPDAVESRTSRRVVLEEPDLELLLLRFLNELVYLRDADELLLRAQRLEIRGGATTRLEAELVGERLDPGRHRIGSEVKAATAYGLSVREADSGWEVGATLDV